MISGKRFNAVGRNHLSQGLISHAIQLFNSRAYTLYRTRFGSEMWRIHCTLATDRITH